MKDQVDRLKALRNNCNLIGYMIYNLRNTKPEIYQKVVRKRQKETRTYNSVLKTKSWSVNYVFLESPFCGPMFKRLTVDNAKKWTILGVLENVTCNTFEISKWSILVNKMMKQNAKFFELPCIVD